MLMVILQKIAMLIFKRTIERWMEVKNVVGDFTRTIPVSPFVYTEKEIEDRLTLKDFFIGEIFERGKVLYG